MAEVQQTTRSEVTKTAIVVAGSALTLNAAFFALSSMYYKERPQFAMEIGSARWAFAVLTMIVATSSFVAALAPRYIGHGLAVVAGLAAKVAGIMAIRKDMPMVLGITLIIVGVLLQMLVRLSWQHSRGAWAFLISILATFAAVTLFGAPKIRNVVGIGLWHAMIVPSVLVVAVIALTMVRGEYRDRS